MLSNSQPRQTSGCREQNCVAEELALEAPALDAPALDAAALDAPTKSITFALLSGIFVKHHGLGSMA